ncbi:hypothetical protein [Streptomyces tendae]|uniref:hypothetical protein n=1 Tax=Streptomyces tendae TaxID=1932 RepID=UPI0034407D92
MDRIQQAQAQPSPRAGRALAATLALAAGLALTACGATGQPGTPDPAPAVVEPARDSLDQHTRQTFDLTWGMASETQRTTYCSSLAVLGPERSAAEMAAGGGFDDSLDWDLMVELMQAECDAR